MLRVDGRAWALCSLFRATGRPAFDADESALVAGLSEPLGEALRDLTRPPSNRDPRTTDAGPGLMLFDAFGQLTSINDDAQAWLDQLTGDHWEQDEHGIRLPMVVLTTLTRARAIAEERERGHARARTRSASGRWLVCHASCLRTLDGAVEETALVIEPAPASEVVPIIATRTSCRPASARSPS